MSHESDVVATNVRAVGVALADYDVAVFSMSVNAEGKTAVEAKETLKERSAKLSAVLDKLVAEGLVITSDTLKANSSVHQTQAYNNKKNKYEITGFSATYAVTFHTSSMDMVSKVYDALSSLEHIQLAAPAFKLSKLENLHKEALKDAFVKAEERFGMECEVLGLLPSNFKIHSWNVRYSENELARRTASRAGGGAPIAVAAVAQSAGDLDDEGLELVAGKATILVTLDVSMCRK
jgi:uncharacterized protein YggE